MNKSMLLVVLASFSATLIGCGEGPKRNSTENQAILRMKCQSPLAFGGDASGDKENDKLEQILKSKYSNINEPVVVTYLTKSETSGILTTENLGPIAIMTDTADEFVDSTHQIVVTRNCETLTADVRIPTTEFKGLTIKSIGVNDIELAGSLNGVETSVKIKKEGRTKIKISKDRRFVGRDTVKQENLEIQDFANGNVVTKVDVEVKANGKTDKVSFEQMSGPTNNSDKVKVATPVMNLLTSMTTDQTKIDILEAGTTPSAQAPSAPGKLTPDAAPKEVEVSIRALVQFKEEVLETLPAPTENPQTNSEVTPAVEPGAPAAVNDDGTPTPAAGVPVAVGGTPGAAPTSPTGPSTPATATAVN